MRALLLIALAALGGVAKASTRYYVYSCPLSSSASSLSSSSNRDCSSSKRDIPEDIPYGIRHTYIQIGSTCFDWGDWNYPRSLNCNDQRLSCCVSTHRLERTSYTNCASRVGEFETAWRGEGRRYNVISWNCQVYTNKMSQFLSTCDPNAPFG